MTHTLNITVAPNAKEPTRANPTDAGLDLYAHGDYIIAANTTILVDTGVAAAVPDGHVGLLFARSSLHKRYPGARLANGVGVIDSDYRGPIKAAITSHRSTYIEDGAKIVQLVIVPILTPKVEVVDSLDDTARGTGGFGSTDNH
jgi:dUTP pyrophosphatase